WCPTCPLNVAQVYCWDGDNPGIAYYLPGSGNPPHVLPLPAGAHDPDIIVGREGLWGYVVYELSGLIIVDEFFRNSLSPLMISYPTNTWVLSSHGRHPNIDRAVDCFDYPSSAIGIIYEDILNNEIYMHYGGIGAGFGPQISISSISYSSSSIRIYSNRWNPDINISGYQNNLVYQFCALGYQTSPNNGIFVDYFDDNGSFAPYAPNDAFEITVSNSLDIHPRIDGFTYDNKLINGGISSYIITLSHNDEIFFNYNQGPSTWPIINISSTINSNPIVAAAGDPNDIIWESDFHVGNNVMGREINFGIFGFLQPFWKDANEFNNINKTSYKFPSIAFGYCNATLYAMCWWGEDENIYFKEAEVSNIFYRAEDKTPSTIAQQIDKDKNASISSIPKSSHVIITNVLGQLIYNGELNNFETSRLKKGVYLIQYMSGNNKKLLKFVVP
ncbi:MAG: T9SS type A sorting domain-containing protein, partial [Thermaurantimonas sp.]|uniref:T9SS type A sorting domain-containing protein n=1 Tax=Thermaurantimonas sp. TaxID=2681568 RepID=UPI00391A821B